MFGELHDLRHEFPEYNDRTHELKIKVIILGVYLMSTMN